MLVRDPLPANGRTHAVIAAEDVESGRRDRRPAVPPARDTRSTAARSVTQFVGFIPVGRAPDHFHAYDEVVYVLQGDGALHIDGETAPLARAPPCTCPPGSCTASRTPGPGEMHVLGVFRPGGLPRRGLLPRRHEGAVLMPRIERTRRGRLGRERRARRRLAQRRHGRLQRARVLAADAHRPGRRARRAPRSCSPPRTAAASRCRSRAS